MERHIQVPLCEEDARLLKAGDYVYLSGTVYSARDAAHKRMKEALDQGKRLPVEWKNNVIYYMGPSPAPPGFPLGAAGPTTSMRMDPFSPLLIENGLRLMIGKGPRSEEVRMAIGRHKGLYLQAYGGCGALYSSCVRKAEVIAYPELGPEALLRLEIENFPAFCMIDSKGNLYNG